MLENVSTLGKEFTTFFEYIYTQRVNLLDQGLNQRPIEIINKVLKRLKNFIGYEWDNKTAATFIISHLNELYYIINPESIITFARLQMFYVQAKNQLNHRI